MPRSTVVIPALKSPKVGKLTPASGSSTVSTVSGVGVGPPTLQVQSRSLGQDGFTHTPLEQMSEPLQSASTTQSLKQPLGGEGDGLGVGDGDTDGEGEGEGEGDGEGEGEGDGEADVVAALTETTHAPCGSEVAPPVTLKYELT